MNPLLNINTDEVKAFHNLTEEQLFNCTINDIINMNKTMLDHKKQQSFNTNNKDMEYKRIVKKYFTPFSFLNQFWSENEIITACAKHLFVSDIVEEYNIPCDRLRTNPTEYAAKTGYEYLHTASATIPRYTKSGEQLLYGETKQCFIFRRQRSYQGIRHGNVILELLYGTYPTLREFQFKAYEYHENETIKYEIYPNTICCYTPFQALMEKDIPTIIKRNEDYCKLYNHGVYTLKQWSLRLQTPELQHYFDVIRTLPITTK